MYFLGALLAPSVLVMPERMAPRVQDALPDFPYGFRADELKALSKSLI